MTEWLLTDSGHIIPLEDLREHERTKQCWCQPIEDDDVTVHNSLDRREDYETGRMELH